MIRCILRRFTGPGIPRNTGRMNTFFTQLNTLCIHAGSAHPFTDAGETPHALSPEPGTRILYTGNRTDYRRKHQRNPAGACESRIVRAYFRAEAGEPAVLLGRDRPFPVPRTPADHPEDRRDCRRDPGFPFRGSGYVHVYLWIVCEGICRSRERYRSLYRRGCFRGPADPGHPHVRRDARPRDQLYPYEPGGIYPPEKEFRSFRNEHNAGREDLPGRNLR